MCNVALKTPLYFYRMMEKRIGYYFQVQSPYYQVANCNKKIIPVEIKTYSCVVKKTGQV